MYQGQLKSLDSRDALEERPMWPIACENDFLSLRVPENLDGYSGMASTENRGIDMKGQSKE